MKGVEPPRHRRQILSLVRLPIPPHPHTSFLVEDGGFEPPKAQLTDLQSAPFGHSGNPPYKNGAGNRTRTYNLLITSQLLYQLSHTSILFKKYFGDLEGARTLDLQRDRLAF